MLFIESKTLADHIDHATSVHLLEELREKQYVPLIYSSRRRCFELALTHADGTFIESQVKEMEQSMDAAAETEARGRAVRGDLLCMQDHVLFIIFGDVVEPTGVRAGIVYSAETLGPMRKLNTFCAELSDILADSQAGARQSGGAVPFTDWRADPTRTAPEFARFVARQDIDSLYTTARKETVMTRRRAAELLEDESARMFLRRTREAHAEGYAAKLLIGDSRISSEPSVNRLSESGLLKREVLISCRQTGHALFHLPSPDALAVITVSQATCSECGAPVADEKVEEVVAPTDLAAALLDDGSWLVNRLLSLLRQLGVPDSEIAIGPAAGDGEAHLMANVCGESFLFVLRDGDLTAAFARRALDLGLESEAAHLIIVATGRVHNEARARLHEHARRRARGGGELSLQIVEGLGPAASEIRDALERASRHALAEHLCLLDASLGLNATRLIQSRLELMKRPAEVVASLAAASSDWQRNDDAPSLMITQGSTTSTETSNQETTPPPSTAFLSDM